MAASGLPFDRPPIERFAVRGAAFVLVAILAFAVMMQGIGLQTIVIPLTIPPLGLVASTFCAFMISIIGSTEMRWLQSISAAAAMTAFCVGLFGYRLTKHDFEPAPPVLAFVLGPLMEKNLRRAMVLARGDATVVLTRPISAGLIAAAALLLVLAVLPMIRKRRDEVFVE